MYDAYVKHKLIGSCTQVTPDLETGELISLCRLLCFKTSGLSERLNDLLGSRSLTVPLLSSIQPQLVCITTGEISHYPQQPLTPGSG